ncbi:cytochrome P450 [Coniophora puteana RWD-64-598 SS2]|uniref:Cytochrome P450 n=1 Tax=Coniophora puteana (strain RWD-64-598) TaxID=741705 RepID=A0A5M3N565_CONPW|nr:cytochrome P450 [Coniophora puteana RWD-64-598 SS2]EIW86397.1 cytochrome P450 [Coniophora puteana RWD-64-598 SS2]
MAHSNTRPRCSSWIWGEEKILFYSRPGSHYISWHQSYGKVVKFFGPFGQPMLSITDPSAVSFILGKGTYLFPKPSGVRAWFSTLLGEGILWVEGKDAHERQRRTLGPALSQQSAKNMTNIFYENAHRLVGQWSGIIERTSDRSETIDVTGWCGRLALDTIGRAAFSWDFGCLREDIHTSTLAETMDSLTNHEHSRASFYMRALFWVFPSVLHLGKKGKTIRRIRKELGDIARCILNDAKEVKDDSSKTVMSLMMRADKNTAFEDEEVAAQMRTIISAGYEPVSAAMTWLLYEISTNIEWQERLRQEVSACIEPSADELSSLPLLDAFLLETLRCHPPVLENHHEASETIAVPVTEPLPGIGSRHLIVPKGTILEMPVNVIHKDPAIWGDDADVFRPERWLQDKSRKLTVRDLLAFSSGPRACLGRSFALAEMKALALTLLQNFAFSCEEDIEPFQSFVIRPRVKGQGISSLPLVVQALRR